MKGDDDNDDEEVLVESSEEEISLKRKRDQDDDGEEEDDVELINDAVEEINFYPSKTPTLTQKKMEYLDNFDEEHEDYSRFFTYENLEEFEKDME